MRFDDGSRVDVVMWSIDFVFSSEKVAFMVEHLIGDPLFISLRHLRDHFINLLRARLFIDHEGSFLCCLRALKILSF